MPESEEVDLPPKPDQFGATRELYEANYTEYMEKYGDYRRAYYTYMRKYGLNTISDCGGC